MCTSSGNKCVSQCFQETSCSFELYFVYGFWRDLRFVFSSIEKHTENLSQRFTFLHQYDVSIRCTAYCSIIPKPFVSSNKETRQRIVACIGAICGCYR